MANLNKVMLIGNLTRDPELKYTPQGMAVAKMGIAINRKYKGKDGDMKEEVEFVNVVVWGKQAENCSKYLTKGRPAYFEGRLQTRSWEDKESKQKRYATEVVADQIQFLGSAGGQGPAQHDGPPPDADAQSRNAGYDPTQDEVPF